MTKKVVSIDEDQIKDWIEKGVKKLENLDCSKKTKIRCGTNGGWFMFVGFIGAAIYLWKDVTTFATGAIAILKACVWPAYLVFNLFKFLNI